MSEAATITQEIAQEAFTDAIRRFVGLRKAHNADSLAEKTGIDARTIRAYCEGQSCPSLGKFLRLAAILGPDFVNRALEPSRIGGAQDMDATCGHQELASSTAHMISSLVDALADGHVDHREEATLEPLVRKLNVATGGWLNRRAASRLGDRIDATAWHVANERSAAS